MEAQRESGSPQRSNGVVFSTQDKSTVSLALTRPNHHELSTRLGGSEGREQRLLTNYLQGRLRDIRFDQKIATALPVPHNVESLVASCQSGVLLCQLLNVVVPYLINAQALANSPFPFVGNKSDLTREEQLQNCRIALVAAGEIGCDLADGAITEEKIVDGEAAAIFALLKQIMWIDCSRQISLLQHPELHQILLTQHTNVLFEEVVKKFENSSLEDKLLRWINYHLTQSNAKPLKSFSELDARTYLVLLKRIAFPNISDHTIASRTDAELATFVVDIAKQVLKTRLVAVEPDDILNHDEFINRVFVAELCHCHMGIPTNEIHEKAESIIKEVLLQKIVASQPPIQSVAVLDLLTLVRVCDKMKQSQQQSIASKMFDLTTKNSELEQTIAALREELAELESERDLDKVQIESLQKDFATFRRSTTLGFTQEKEELEQRIAALEKALAMERRSNIRKNSSKLREMEQQHIRDISELARKDVEVSKLQQELKDMEDKMVEFREALKDVEDRYCKMRDEFTNALIAGGDQAEEKALRARFPKTGVVNITPDANGYIWKEGSNWKSWKKRWFVLHGYWLIYYVSELSDEPAGFCCVINCKIEEAPYSEIKRENGFKVVMGTRTLLCSTDTKEEKEMWMRAIQKAATYARKMY